MSMYPSRFRYEARRSVEEALELLGTYGDEAKVLAGGQSLIPLIKLRFATLELLVDTNNLPDLPCHVMEPDGSLRIAHCAVTATSSAPSSCVADSRRWRPQRR
jgi:carbon-monoxide dehydrogenase medium subunit